MNKLKQETQKLGALMLALLMFLATAPLTQVHANTEPLISIFVDGQPVHFADQAPNIIDVGTLIPVRGVFDALGFDVSWNPDLKQVTLVRADGVTIVVTTDSDYYRVGDKSGTDSIPFIEPAKIINGSIVLPLREVLDKVGYNVSGDAQSQIIFISPYSGTVATVPLPTVAVVVGDDVVWLDTENSVSRFQIVNRLSQHQVRDNRVNNNNTMRTLGEQARAYNPLADKLDVLGRAALVRRAVGYSEGFLNVNYRTDTVNKYENLCLMYSTSPDRKVEEWKKYAGTMFQAIVDQQLIMTSVFVTSENLVYKLSDYDAARLRNGSSGIPTPYAVRGTLFYKLDSISEGQFWFNLDYELGQWYWIDVEYRFQESFTPPGSPTTAITEPNKVMYINPDGTIIAQTRLNERSLQPLSRLP